MNSTPAFALEEIVRRHGDKPLLRFITCGSVDDGKSTLIGRLLFDSKSVFEDQLAALGSDSRRHGTQGAALDYALLLDGLEAEREQGITIDVAYRFFDTQRRKFIVADCPGHAQYTRNMATGASTADLAVVLVDARKGLLTQTRRHSYIAALFGIRRIVLAVNKMDQVAYSSDVFDTIADDYRALARQLGIAAVQCIPLSALEGENVLVGSSRMPWYSGPALLEHLETVDIDPPVAGDFRLPVQLVLRPHQDFRGYSGNISSGRVQVGDAVVALPSGARSSVAAVIGMDGERSAAGTGEAVTLTLADDIDISRGDVLCAAQAPAQISDQFAAHVLWMDDAPLLPGRPYLLQLGTSSVGARITGIKHVIDVDTQAELAATHLELNEVGVCNLSLDQPIAFESYDQDRTLGGFILIDRQTNATVAAGTLDFALRRAANLHWQHIDVGPLARARAKGQQPRCVWFTGLSGSGKSTIANLVDKRLHAMGLHSFVLDGDNVRHGLNRDLGFTDEDRVENLRRVAEVARLLADAGLIVLVSFISPFRADRAGARALFAAEEFIEVHVDTPLDVAEQRDVKGLYAKARRGELPHFTGIDSPYEAPEDPELHLATEHTDAADLAERVVAQLRESLRV